MDISGIVTSILEQIKQTVRSETVIGQPVQAEDSIIIPVSRVSFGFGVGIGSGDRTDSKKGEGGGAGGGATIEPVAFVVVSKGRAQILPLKSREATITHIIDMIPMIFDFIKETHKTKGEGGEHAPGTGSAEESI